MTYTASVPPDDTPYAHMLSVVRLLFTLLLKLGGKPSKFHIIPRAMTVGEEILVYAIKSLHKSSCKSC